MDVNFNERMADEAIARLSLPERLRHFAMRIKGRDEPYWLMQEAANEIDELITQLQAQAKLRSDILAAPENQDTE